VRPTQSISELLKDVKGSSSKWINENNFVTGSFSWQEGYGAFSYGKSQVREVIHYIENQKEHHKLKTFKEEYVDFLDKFEVEYDEKYIFQPLI
jgi:putative transposase